MPGSPTLSRKGQIAILLTALLGWMLAGMIMAIVPSASRAAIESMLGSEDEGEIDVWFSYSTCAPVGCRCQLSCLTQTLDS